MSVNVGRICVKSWINEMHVGSINTIVHFYFAVSLVWSTIPTMSSLPTPPTWSWQSHSRRWRTKDVTTHNEGVTSWVRRSSDMDFLAGGRMQSRRGNRRRMCTTVRAFQGWCQHHVDSSGNRWLGDLRSWVQCWNDMRQRWSQLPHASGRGGWRGWFSMGSTCWTCRLRCRQMVRVQKGLRLGHPVAETCSTYHPSSHHDRSSVCPQYPSRQDCKPGPCPFVPAAMHARLFDSRACVTNIGPAKALSPANDHESVTHEQDDNAGHSEV